MREAIVGAGVLGLFGLIACGGHSGTGDDGDGGISIDAAPPAAICSRPPLVDTSAPTTTVGDGTAASCTAAALQAAATAGGTIVFNCGGPITITVTAPITFTKEAVLDGGG